MTIYGPRGEMLTGGMKVGVNGSTVSVTKGNETYEADPEQVLMEMARAQVRGWSHKQIIAHYQLVGRAASPYVLERALERGRALLKQAIAAGRAPEDAPINDPIDYAREKFDDDDV